MSNLQLAIAPFKSFAAGTFGSDGDKNPALAVKNGDKIFFVPLIEGKIEERGSSKVLIAKNHDQRSVNYDANSLNFFA